MADTAKGTVYGKREGSGLAQVFPQQANPLAVFLNQKKNAQVLGAKRKLADDAARAKRDTAWDKLEADVPNPEYWKEMTKSIQTEREGIKNFYIKARESGIDMNDARFKREQARRLSEFQQNADRTFKYKQSLEEALEAADSDHYTTEMKSAIRDQYFDAKGTWKGVDNVDRESVFDPLKNVQYYNRANIGRDFVKNVPNKVREMYSTYYDNIGKKFDIDQFNSDIYELEDGKIIMENGMPKIKLSDHVMNAARADEEISNILAFETRGLEDKPERRKQKELQVMEKLLRPWSKTELKESGKGAGSNSRGSGYQGSLNLSPAKEYDIADYKDAAINGLVGTRGVNLDAPNLGRRSTFLEFEVEDPDDGSTSTIAADVEINAFQKIGDDNYKMSISYKNPDSKQVTTSDIPFDNQMEQYVRNVISKDAVLLNEFDSVISELKKSKIGKIYRDDNKINGVVTSLNPELTGEEFTVENVNEILEKSKAGVRASSVDNAGRWGNVGHHNNQKYIKIDGKEYWLPYYEDGERVTTYDSVYGMGSEIEDDEEELKALLFNSSQENFIRHETGEDRKTNKYGT